MCDCYIVLENTYPLGPETTTWYIILDPERWSNHTIFLILSHVDSRIKRNHYAFKEYIDDYLNRRKTNLEVLLKSLELVKDGLFDYFIVPQDDASVYGFTAIDQIKVRSFIKENYFTMQDCFIEKLETDIPHAQACVVGDANISWMQSLHFPNVVGL